jgi:cystathionine beta-synthase
MVDKPGGTIIEGTSEIQELALVAIIKGYKLICVMSDKQSKRKWISFVLLEQSSGLSYRCEPTDPRSYYSVSKRLANETPNSWYVNQYDNPSNAIAHYE